MRKIYLIIICALLLVGCTNNNEENELSIIMKLESERTILEFNIEELSKTNISNDNFKYDEDKVGKNEVVLYLYYSSTCPHCHDFIEWLDSVKDKYPYLKVIKKEASENMAEYEKVVTRMDINDYHVPLTIIGDTYYIGFAKSKISYFDSMIKYYSTVDSCDMVDAIINNKDIENCKQINKK